MSGTNEQPPTAQPEFAEVQRIRDLGAFDEHLADSLAEVARRTDSIKAAARARLEATCAEITRHMEVAVLRVGHLTERLDSVNARLVILNATAEAGTDESEETDE